MTAYSLASLPPKKRAALLNRLTDEDAAALLHDWSFWARDNQMPPAGSWRVWLVMAGRGFGKTRTGAEAIHHAAKSGAVAHIHLIAPTASDARDVMVEGESGILSIAGPWERPVYEPSKRRLTWPNGCRATLFAAETPERLRGPQCGLIWADEIGSWEYQQETWDMAMFGLRIGSDPRAIVTTTPRPSKLMRQLLDDPHTIVTRGSTYDNRANLADAFFDAIVKRYEGTRLGRQELAGEYLNDTPGALWTMKMLDETRVTQAPDCERIVVGVDPAVTSGEDSDSTGIVVVGKHGDDLYVLDDRTIRSTPQGWAAAAVRAYHDWGADRIVAEVNNGGDLVETIVRSIDSSVSYRAVRASRGKLTRAEPIAALYEQGRGHVVGSLPRLEEQMTTYVPGMDSPDALDAMVWASTDLAVTSDVWFSL